jgi:hydrogenase expression/formation protein HypE
MSESTILLAHGGGGRLSRDLVQREIVTRFGDGPLRGLPDAARLPAFTRPLVFTTDSYVVQPAEFPGGCIGDLAVHGTVNDLAVSGGVPRWLSVGLILEEGLPIELLRRVLDALQAAARACGVTVATGDTKVVARGQCDQIYINTAGLGEALEGFALGPDRIRPGDRNVASGTLGDHGAAVLAAREKLALGPAVRSDTGPVHRLVQALQPLAGEVRFMRDPTRGGAAAVLNELAEDHGLTFLLDDAAIPLSAGTRALTEILGLDPLHLASEGRLLAVCAPAAAEAIVCEWRRHPEGAGAAIIGTVLAPEAGSGARRGRVLMDTVVGGRRLVDFPQGELLPRIC